MELANPANPAQFNAYNYSGNNPLTWSDPSGMDFWSDLAKNAKKALNAAGSWVQAHSAEIIGTVAGVVVGAIVTGACLAGTAGIGSVGCLVLGGMAGGAVSGALTAGIQLAQSGKPLTLQSALGVVGSAYMGAAFGALGGLAGAGVGVLLGRAATSLASSLAGGATGGSIRTALTTAAQRVTQRISQSLLPSRPTPSAGSGSTVGGSATNATSTAAGQTRNALGQFTSASGGESAATAAGRTAHASYPLTLGWSGGDDVAFNQAMPGSLLRPDAINWTQRVVAELKPDSAGAIAAGWRQVNRYVAYLEELTGESWTAQLDVYTRP